jgi:gliding motility-associated-like protein
VVNWGTTNAHASLEAVGATALGCPTDTARLPVRVNPLLITPTPGGGTQLCAADAKGIWYETSFTNGSTYNWKVIGGTIVSPDPTDHQIQVDWQQGISRGKIVVTQISTTDLARCFGQSDTLYVDFLPSPDPTLPLVGPASVCENTQNLTYCLNGRPGSTYRWSLNGTALPGTANSTTVQVAAAGTYTLSVVETTNAGCTGHPIERKITVHPLPAAQTINGPLAICPENRTGLPFQLSGLPGSTYQWTVTGGSIRAGQGTDKIVVDFDDTADKALTVLETSAAGCVGPLVSLPVQYDAASLQLSVASTDEQDEQKIVLQLSMPRNGSNGSSLRIYRREAGQDWTKVGEVPNTATSYTDATADPDGKPYFYKIESTNACGTPLATAAHKTIWLQASENEQQETVTLRWTRYRGWDSGVKEYQVFRKVDSEPEYTLYRTVPASDTALTFLAAKDGFRQAYRIRALPTGGGSLASWSNDDGVSFENPLVFYNIFTPNGDGANETFFIDNIHLYPGNELTIFNRWGKEVYRRRNYDNSWDGKELANGAYYYQLLLPDRTQRKGWVEIVR